MSPWSFNILLKIKKNLLYEKYNILESFLIIIALYITFKYYLFLTILVRDFQFDFANFKNWYLEIFLLSFLQIISYFLLPILGILIFIYPPYLIFKYIFKLTKILKTNELNLKFYELFLDLHVNSRIICNSYFQIKDNLYDSIIKRLGDVKLAEELNWDCNYKYFISPIFDYNDIRCLISNNGYLFILNCSRNFEKKEIALEFHYKINSNIECLYYYQNLLDFKGLDFLIEEFYEKKKNELATIVIHNKINDSNLFKR